MADSREQDNPGQELRLGHWFIRNDDCPYIKLIATVAIAMIAVTATGGITAAALAEPIASFAAACWKVKRKGTTLSTDQVAVLGALNATRRATLEHLVMNLAAGGYALDERAVQAALYSLQAVELCDGSVIAIVCQDSDENWRALER